MENPTSPEKVAKPERGTYGEAMDALRRRAIETLVRHGISGVLPQEIHVAVPHMEGALLGMMVPRGTRFRCSTDAQWGVEDLSTHMVYPFDPSKQPEPASCDIIGCVFENM